MDRVSRFLVRHGRWLAIGAILSVVLPASTLPRAAIDNSIEVWLDTRSEAYRQYRDFLDRFGNEEFVVIAAEADDPLADEVLAAQRDLVEKLSRIETVKTTLSLSSLADGLSQVRPDWKGFLAGDELVRNLVIGPNGRSFGILVWLKRIEVPAVRRRTIEQIESAVRDSAIGRYQPHLAGTPLMNVALDRGSQQASRTFLPVALLVSVLILAGVLRSLPGVIAVIASVAVTTVWTIGLLIASGKTLNMVTVTLPSLLCVLSLSGGIHITSRFIALCAQHGGRTEAMRQTLNEVAVPIFLSAVTTAVGFASLMISTMRPVVDFGIFAAVGILLSFMVNLVVVPGLLLLLPGRRSAGSTASAHWAGRIGLGMARTRTRVIGVSLVLLIVCIGWTTQARVESNVLKFFPDDSVISRDYDYIRRNLTGFYTVELEFVTDRQNGKALLQDIEHLADRFAQEPEVAKTLHYGSLARLLTMVRQHVVVEADPTGNRPLREMMDQFRRRDDDRIRLRMSVFVRAMSSRQFYSLLNRMQAAIHDTIDPTTETVVTGVVPLLNAAQQSLIDTQIKSFSLACAVVLAMIAMFMKSIRAMVAALLPNLLPIFALFSLMALAGIAIDAATVMIASIAIGIAADDTIHFLSHFRTHRLAGEDVHTAIGTILGQIGPAITLTSGVATVGFLILCMAQFSPIRYFGLMAAVTMVTAWMGDVLVLPACVSALQLWADKRRAAWHE